MKTVVRNIDEKGRVMLPKVLMDLFGFDDKVELTITENGILLLPYNPNSLKCEVTGQVTEDLKLYCNSIILSTEGAKKLLEEITKELEE